jgi:C-terminal processing protease CtpA/Prc
MKKYATFKMLCSVVLAVLAWVAPSCSDKDFDDQSSDTNTTTATINTWILENMQGYYLWNDYLPTRTDKNLAPDAYFASLLYRAEDRFSWIQDNFVELMESLSGVNLEAGYEFQLYRRSDTSKNLLGMMRYVKPNSPAALAGLKRGDIFTQVNGTQLDTLNYINLLDQISEPHTLYVGDIQTPNFRTVQLSVVRYEENPILLDTVLTLGGKQIGYLVYNMFAADNGDGSISYERELNNVFGQFKAAGINELVLDLRYNGGGLISTAIALASMISGKPSSELFGLMQYNKPYGDYLNEKYPGYTKDYFADYLNRYNASSTAILERVPINKLEGLQQLYVIATGHTASASELLINGLRPYMPVHIIGSTTYGKNVGSVTIYEADPVKQKTNKWGMQPIVLKAANSLGFSDYGNGFTPTVEVKHEDETIPFADLNELMLRAALQHIGVLATSRSVRHEQQPMQPLWSSDMRHPERKNMYIIPQKIE